MDLWAIVVTGGVGLAAGQIGAWLQGRRDAAADRRRQSAEIERLNVQLEDGRKTQEIERRQKDLLEWRERRLSAYQLTSDSHEEILKPIRTLLRADELEVVEEAVNEIYRIADELEDQLNKCALISTNPTRDAASQLTLRLYALRIAVASYEKSVSELAEDSEMGKYTLATIRHRGRVFKEFRSNPAYSSMESFLESFTTAAEEFAEAAENWRGAAREELGVPD
ncbi:hypothetical protein ACQHIV_29265 [Kribbella sp. GL6]|uniref:hypothetical protein n=1 Tax=Kribbella sp. GL6 TaxID=3419765 RepID=UPI003CFF609C